MQDDVRMSLGCWYNHQLGPAGEGHEAYKLTCVHGQVICTRWYLATGTFQRDIRDITGISQTSLCRIVPTVFDCHDFSWPDIYSVSLYTSAQQDFRAVRVQDGLKLSSFTPTEQATGQHFITFLLSLSNFCCIFFLSLITIQSIKMFDTLLRKRMQYTLVKEV